MAWHKLGKIRSSLNYIHSQSLTRLLGWPWTHSVAQADLEPAVFLPQPPKWLGWQTCVTLPSSHCASWPYHFHCSIWPVIIGQQHCPPRPTPTLYSLGRVETLGAAGQHSRRKPADSAALAHLSLRVRRLRALSRSEPKAVGNEKLLTEGKEYNLSWRMSAWEIDDLCWVRTEEREREPCHG